MSKPVDNTSKIREATQNQTRTEKTRKLFKPSEVTVTVSGPQLDVRTGCPGVKNRTGIEIIAVNKGMRISLEMKFLIGIPEAKANTKGRTQIKRR